MNFHVIKNLTNFLQFRKKAQISKSFIKKENLSTLEKSYFWLLLVKSWNFLHFWFKNYKKYKLATFYEILAISEFSKLFYYWKVLAKLKFLKIQFEMENILQNIEDNFDNILLISKIYQFLVKSLKFLKFEFEIKNYNPWYIEIKTHFCDFLQNIINFWRKKTCFKTLLAKLKFSNRKHSKNDNWKKNGKKKKNKRGYFLYFYAASKKNGKKFAECKRGLNAININMTSCRMFVWTCCKISCKQRRQHGQQHRMYVSFSTSQQIRYELAEREYLLQPENIRINVGQRRDVFGLGQNAVWVENGYTSKPKRVLFIYRRCNGGFPPWKYK